MLVCRVIRFILARLLINSNRWLLIRYKQLLHLAHVFASNTYGTMRRLDCGKMILLMIILMKLLLIQVLMLLVIMIYLLVNYLVSLQLLKH